MQASSLPITRLVNVSVNLAPNAAQIQNISTLLVLGSSNIIDMTERYRSYLTLSSVAADFGTSAAEYLAAAEWFSQAPQPTQLLIGRWAQTATAAVLKGASLSGLNAGSGGVLATWTAITAGSCATVIDGVPIALSGLNFSAATAITGVAGIIQTALRAQATAFGMVAAASLIVVWNSAFNRFEVQSGTTGTSSTIQFMMSPTASGFASFSANPANLDTITLNGTAVTFVTGAPVGNQVQIGGTLTITLASLLAFLKASVDAQLVKFDYYVTGNYLYLEAIATGTGGNALTVAKSSTAITLSGATLSGAGTVDISATLGLNAATSGSYVSQGAASETALAATTAFDNQYGQTWYGLFIPGASDADHQAVASFIEGTTNKHTYWVGTNEAGVLTSTSTTDIAYLLSIMNLNRTIVHYSSTNVNAVASLAAKSLTINYNGNNTVIDDMYKQEPGIIAETINATQVTALEAKNCNVFLQYNNNTAIIEPGNNVSGVPIDIITGTDWLALTIQTAVYNLLYLTATKIPQTDAGNHTILTTIESVLSQAVTNGLLAPGVWTTGGFGAINQGDFLPKGFYVYAPPVASQLTADRSARKSVLFQIAAKLAGAIRTVSVMINVNR